MTSHLCLTVRFLQPYYNGRRDRGEPEWPPSPLRLYQALVASAARRWGEDRFRDEASPSLRWLERQPTPAIAATDARQAKTQYRLYVPDNTGDLAAGAWSRGNTTRIVKRTEKDIRPMHLPDFAEAHYLFPLLNGTCPHLDTLTAAARSITHLGWGVDMVAGNASVLSESQVAELPGNRWRPVDDLGAVALRAPIVGTLDALIAKHRAFLDRITRDARGNESFNPVPPLTAFRVSAYRRCGDSVPRRSVVFELRNDDGSRFSYPQAKLIHIAGMVRHLAIGAMKGSPPEGVDDDWVETYVAGHAKPDAAEHRQFSYLPLPSIGHLHTDPSVRRIMVAAPVGDDRYLKHLARLLDGQQLKPTPETKLDHRPTLLRIGRDNVTCCYTGSATKWASVTPVILPGHDDRKPAKTRKLILKALRQSGIEQACEFEWSAFSRFPKSLSAHKFDRDRRLIGYIRPDHLLNLTAVHLHLTFLDKRSVSGPIAIGAGRHCGLGLFATPNDT